jgi:hypothetical protein
MGYPIELMDGMGYLSGKPIVYKNMIHIKYIIYGGFTLPIYRVM